jgi:Ca2+-binding RTX toxin-like protein
VLNGGLGDDALVGDDTDLVGGLGGADVLTGGAGNDYLGGGGGSDTYLFNSGDGFDVIRDFAGEGNRLVFGSGISAEALIVTATASDSLVIRTGNGGDAVEILNFGTTNFSGSHPFDTFEFSDGTVLTYTQLVANGLGISGGFGSDTLSGTADSEQIFGGAGNDTILGLDGADRLFGEDGEDRLEGGAGNDRLLGGRGNDQLTGATGQDTYMFALGGGIDQIQDAPGENNRLIFGSGISATTLSLGLKQIVTPGEGGEGEGGSGAVRTYLVLRTGGLGDAVEIEGFDPANQSAPLAIEEFVFADGTVLTSAQLIARGLDLVGTVGFDTLDGHAIYRTIRGLAGDDLLIGGSIDNVIEGSDGRDVLFGNGGLDQLSGGAGDDVLQGGDGDDVLNGDAGNDSLEGEAGDDVLIGGTGDDQLSGGEGNDTYRFNIGDGFDSLFDSGSGTDTDRVVFGSGITSSMVSLSSQFGQMVIKVGSGSEGLQSGSVFDVFGTQAIEQFQFSDGSSLNYGDLVARGFDIDGTEFDDFLSGTNVIDRIRGGLGNDRLEGGEGNDAYFFNLGDGTDTITDTASVVDGNEVVFGAGITSADLRLDLASDQSDSSRSDLLIRVGTNDDAVQLDTFDRNNALDLRTVESFRFADGGTLTYEQLLARGFDVTGTDGDDQIAGTNVVDRIVAGAGADVLRSGFGDDRLDGGAGNDQLIGGQGNDIYVFGSGFGQDTIIEVQGSQDAIRFATGVSPSDVVVTRYHNDLVFSLNGGIDRLTVSHYFLAPLFQIELVQFDDGTVWDQAFIDNLVQPGITGTEGPDVLVGTQNDDRLVGLAGDDQLSGLAGNDLLDGGTGADQLAGGTGDDIYLIDDVGDVVTELANEGVDSVQSHVTRALDAHVENLVLAGTADLNGTGNELDNVLRGNSGANVLRGGAGDDTYIVGEGDTVVEFTGEGTDTVQTGISATLGADVENLTLTGSASLTGTGNNLDNVLSADGSISILAGGDGNDTYVIGPNGDDDILIETVTGGTDTVIAAHDYRLPANIENLTLLDPRVPDFASFSLIPYGSTEQSVTGYGNDLANTLIGGRANNVLDGGLGADTLIGGAGHDTYIVDNIGDIVNEQAQEGTDDVIHSSVTYTLSANVEHLTLIGTESIDGTGNALNNDIRGNEASNVLDGRAGNDGLQGFGGADTYLFGRGAGQDIVFDSSQNGEVDTIQLASDVTVADLEVYRVGYNLVLVISGTPDDITLWGFFDQPAYAHKQVRFADGTLWSEADLRTRAVTVGGMVTGTNGNDALTGSAGDDRLIGADGDDVLAGGRGNDWLYGDLTSPQLLNQLVLRNDTLIGGPGNDVLVDFQGMNLFDGGAGDDFLTLGVGQDTVRFGRGSGTDWIEFDRNGNDVDIIELAADLTPADIQMTRRSPGWNKLIDLTIQDTGEKLILSLSNNYPSVLPETTQAVVRFTDGTEWSFALIPPDLTSASAGDDVMTASFPATLAGFGGNDTYIFGSSGVPGTYAVIEAAGEGIDTVQSRFSYTLDDHVENLILIPTYGLDIPNSGRGTGNELDNFIIGNSSDNILDGGAGNDVLVGGIFRGLEGPPYIEATGSDILIGGAGDDVLMADGGDLAFDSNVSSGGWLFVDTGVDVRDDIPRYADDFFLGGLGNDTYIVHGQAQTVVESENEGTDTVKSTVSYVLGGHLENLELISPPPIFDGDENVIPQPPLNGTGNELNNVLIGSEDENVLSGLTGHDTLAGRLGNDSLRGGAGYDTYFFNLGDGIDTIEDSAAAGEGNRIQFGIGISRDDLTITHDEAARTLTIQVGTSGMDRLVLKDFDLTGVNGTPVVETLTFADGGTASLAGLFGPTITEEPDTITTGAGDDVIDALGGDDIVDAGAGNDILTGDTGDDTLIGGPGDDTYIYNSGDGIDTINDTSLPGEGNTLQFGPGIDPANLSLRVGSLVISVGTNGDAIHLTNFDPTNVFGPRTIETFRFADGTILSYDQLVQRGFDLTGTDGNDAIAGTNVADRITALAGDDTLAGGGGKDHLHGGAGRDTYIFNIGDGVDIIDDTALPGAGNRIQYGAGISQSDLTFTQDAAARTLTIQVGPGGTDRLVLAGFDPRGANGSLVVSTLEFADGNMVDLVDLYPPNHAPTVATPLVDQTVAEGTPFAIRIPATTFTDLDPGDVLTLSASLADGTALPSWLLFDTATGTLSAIPDDAQVGSFDLTVTATDRETERASDTFTLTITNVNEAPTVVVPVPDQVAAEDSFFTFAVPATTFTDADVAHGDALVYEASLGDGSPLPAWLSFDPTTLTFSGMPGPGDAGVLQLAVAALDQDTLSATDFFTLSIAGPLPQTLVGTSGNDVVAGGRGDDTLSGLAGNDTLNGGAGHDLLDGGTGNDTMVGSTGNDTYVVDAVSDVVTELADEGTDTVHTSLFIYTLGANVEDLILTGAGPSSGIGNSLNNQLTGNDGANLLDGKAGTDTMAGAAGNDVYMVNQVGDVVVEQVHEGVDSVLTTVSYQLPTNVEHIVLTGSAAINGTGNEMDNTLTGNSASNVLAGLAGDDTYLIGAGDTVIEASDNGTDTVMSSVAHALAANVENLTLVGFNAITGTGNELDNVLNGLLNLAGNTLAGGAGNDMYVIGSGDTVVEAVGGGIDTVQTNATHTLGANVENLMLTGTSAVNGTGNGLNNILIGNHANNVLNGGSGNDTLIGGRGNDGLIGGAGNDTFQFSRGDGQDLVRDNNGANDKLLYDSGINPLDLVISRQAEDLRLAIHGSTDYVTVQNWYAGSSNRTEMIQAGNGDTLLNTQVDQLIQAMAAFTQQTGLTWDQAIDQRPQDVQAVLAASWQ